MKKSKQRLKNPCSTADIASRIIAKEQFDFGHFFDHQNIREAIAASVPGMAQLKDIAIAKKEFHIQGRIKHTPEFKTASGKAKFIVHNAPTANTKSDDYPFLLASIRSEGQFNSIIYEENDTYRYNAPRNAVLMSPEDIEQFGFENGQRVDLISPFGTMKNAKVTAFELPRGNVMAYYPEANSLTGDELDPRSLTPNFKSIPVKVQNPSAV